ncbi:MAG: hypothetical protein OEZ43_20925 [Gammaproteobacteria bacterium]|nr:hypothetical protein [Gammaproteobacteria bacterium]
MNLKQMTQFVEYLTKDLEGSEITVEDVEILEAGENEDGLPTLKLEHMEEPFPYIVTLDENVGIIYPE